MSGFLIMAIGVGVVTIAVGVAVFAHSMKNRDADGPGGGAELDRRGRTRDARGRRVSLIDPWPMYAMGRHDVIDAEALERIVDELEPGVRRRRKLLFVGLAIGVVALAGVGVAIAIEGAPALSDLISTVTNPAIFAAVIGGAVAPWIATRQERLRRVRGVMLRHRRCPHCGYGLTGVPPHEGDGTTVCPECASAWRVDEDEPGRAGGVASPATQRRTTVMLLVMVLLTGLAVLGSIAFLAMR